MKILLGDGTGSDASVYYRDKFEEVLVDEYQDINRLQEAILYWVRQVSGDHGKHVHGRGCQTIDLFISLSRPHFVYRKIFGI